MTSDNKIYVVAEIGHNHKGSIEEAKKLFREAKAAGANAVKLQKRDNKSLYTKKFYNQIYDNPNSYGETYGKHREALEFNFDQYKELQSYAKSIEIDFFATPFDLNSLNFNRLHTYIVSLDDENKKNLFEISDKINGKLSLLINKIFSKRTLINSAESQLRFVNGNILIEQFLISLGKLGAADFTGSIENKKKLNSFLKPIYLLTI